MTASGSATETDDELQERIHARQTRVQKAHDPAESNHTTAGSRGGVKPRKASNTVRSSPSAKTTDTAMETTTPKTIVAEADHTQEQGSQKKSGFLALILNSDDDEPPRFDPLSEQVEERQPPAQETLPIDSKPVAVPGDHSTSPIPMQSIENHALPAVQESVFPTPVQHEDTVPDDQFISPFASLSVAYHPPPPPVYGAPPVSCVPGRVVTGPAIPNASAHAEHCRGCSRVLSSHGSSVSQPGHWACACCQQYYSEANNHARVSAGRVFCTECFQAHAPVQRRSPTSTSEQRVYPCTNATYTCPSCKVEVRKIPPRTNSRKLRCNCCLIEMSIEAFSKKQRRSGHPCRRCNSCLKTRKTPDKFKNLRHQAKQAKLAKGVLAQEQSKSSQQSKPTTVPSSDYTPEERRQMEIEVRNFKLAKRLIQRRREANDLRGSTREEYIKQLENEEQKLDAKIARVRASSPALYDEVNRTIKVKRAVVLPSERDNAGNKKKTKKTAQPKTAKRKSTQTPEPKATKRAKTTTKKKATRPNQSAELSETSSSQRIATRARIRQAAKSIVVIDLVDSNSE